MQHIPMLDKSDIFFDMFVSLMRQRTIKAHNKIDPSGGAVWYVTMQDPKDQNYHWIVLSRECDAAGAQRLVYEREEKEASWLE
jgi:hypothetical protein